MTNHSASPITVIVVDNEDFFRAKVESWLRANPRFHCAGSFSDGETALMELVSKNPVVAVIDLALPGIKGDEVIWRVKERTPSIKIAAVSGIHGDSVVLDALDAGADGFLGVRQRAESTQPGRCKSAVGPWRPDLAAGVCARHRTLEGHPEYDWSAARLD
jgi:DNA-binding NarL/FixJ family response regulator